MQILALLLMAVLIACAIAASLNKSLLNTVLIFMNFGVVMSVIWLVLQAPDLAITEAAVGVGVDAVLYFLTLRKINALRREASHEPDGSEKVD